MPKESMDRNHVRKVKLREQGNDFAFWQTQTPEKRLETLEQIRNEYHNNANSPGFQRVYRIVKRK